MIIYLKNLKFLLLLLLSFLLLNCSAQLIPYQHFGIEDGLLDEKCYDIVQDKDGFVWLGTNSSLVRFDGSSFKTYPINGRTDIDVYRIVIQGDRLVLLVENNELYVKEGESIFQPIALKNINKESFNGRSGLFDIITDNYDKVWIALNVGPIQDFIFKSIDRANRVKVVNISINQEVDAYTMSFSNQESVTSSRYGGRFENNHLCLMFEKEGVKGKIDVPFKPDFVNFLSDVKVFSKNSIAISFNEKVLVVINGKELIIPLNEYAQGGGLFFDNDSTLWCATRFGSLNRVSISNIDGKVLSYSITEYPNIIDASNFYKTDDNKLWITSGKNGFNYFSSNQISRFQELEVNDFTFFKKQLILAMQTGYLLYLNVNELDTLRYFDKRIEKIFSTKEQLVVLSYYHENKISKDSLIQNLKYYGVKRIIETDSAFFLSSRNFSRELNVLGNEIWFECNEVNDKLIQLNRHLLYERTGNEIYELYKQGDEYERTLIVGAQNVFDLEATKNGRIFYSDTEGSFFEVFRSDSIVKLLDGHPIFKEKILQIVEDSNHLCIVFKNSILRFNPNNSKEKLGYIFRAPGIYKGQFTKMEINNGIYYWSSASKIYQSRNPFQSECMTPHATYLELDGKSLMGINKVVRDYEDNSIILQSKGFNYSKNPYIKQMVEVMSESGKVLYELKGGEIFLPDLSAGGHKIMTYNLNSLTKQKSGVTRLKILIQKPFWMRIWFWVLCFFVLVLPVIYFVSQRNRSKLEKEKLSNQLSRVRSKAIASQLNPHFIFNALGSIQFLVNEEKPEEANDYLSKFAKLLRLVLEYTEKDWYSFNLERQILELYLSLENLRFKKDTEIIIQNASGLNESGFCIPPLFLQLLVENSVIHGLRDADNKGKIVVEIERHGAEQIQITVLDNGVGFSNEIISKNKSKKSLGLSIIKERLRLISKTEKLVCELDYGAYKDESEFNSFVKFNLPINIC